MLVRIVRGLTEVIEVETSFTSLRSILNYLKQLYGEEFTKELMEQEYKYVLVDSTNRLNPVAIGYEIALQDFSMFDTIFLVKAVAGDGGAVATAIGMTVVQAGVTTLTLAGQIVASIINVALSIALSYAIQALCPTPEFSQDPAASQAETRASNLFNGIPLLREQGGITPLVFGSPFCGGVLISTGITTSDNLI